MLTMDQIYRIRYLKKFEGKSLREIAKITGHDFETVKKYAEKEDFNVKPKLKQKRTGKLSPYEDIVKKWLEEDLKAPHKQRHTAKRVYERLKKNYPEFDASDRSVRTLVARLKEELTLDGDGYIPLEHPPGEAQVDFGDATFVENDVEYDGNYLNMSFPYSNGGYTQLFKAANQECLLEGLKAIFEHIEAVPTSIWFDNMSTAVKNVKSQGERDLTQGFLRFMMHYGFRSNFCNPNSGNEKGSVENKVGYHRRNKFVPIPKFNNLKEYNKKLLIELDNDMQREHYKKKILIKDLFQEDKKAFFKLPKIPYEVYKYEFAKADNYGKIRFDSRIYSAMPTMAKKQVMIKVGAYEIELFDNDSNLIVKHKRLYGGQKESMIWIPYLELMSKRPTALKYTNFFNQLPTTLKTFLDSCDYDCKKRTLKIIVDMTKDSDLENAIYAFEEGIKCGARDADGIWATYCRLNSGSLPEVDIAIPDTLPTLEKYSPNITKYDQLISKGGLQK